MEMKPEYNHGSFNEYHLTLYTQDVGQKVEDVFYTLKRHVPHYRHMKLKAFIRYCQRQGVKLVDHFFEFDEEDAYVELCNELHSSGAKPQVSIDTYYYSINPNVIKRGLSKRERYSWKKHPEQFSMMLSEWKEYSLVKWAQANKLNEAYRVFEEIDNGRNPSDYIIMRVWWDNETFYSTSTFSDLTQHDQNQAGILEFRDWMSENFWAKRNFYTTRERKMGGWPANDGYGSRFLIEGYKNGKYKFIYIELLKHGLKGAILSKMLQNLIKDAHHIIYANPTKNSLLNSGISSGQDVLE